jgi:hypothetical protein
LVVGPLVGVAGAGEVLLRRTVSGRALLEPGRLMAKSGLQTFREVGVKTRRDNGNPAQQNRIRDEVVSVLIANEFAESTDQFVKQVSNFPLKIFGFASAFRSSHRRTTLISSIVPSELLSPQWSSGTFRQEKLLNGGGLSGTDLTNLSVPQEQEVGTD